MVWSYPDISLEDLLNLIKGFVDIVILASGYQSSGLPALWDPSNVKKALQWGLFFEDVASRLSILDDDQASVKELDAAILEMKSDPYFPQGLSELSSATLTRARDFVVRHIIHTLPLRDVHLNALLVATVDMDLDDLRKTEYDSLSVYLEKLMLQSTSTVPQFQPAVPDVKMKEYAGSSHTELVIQEISKRQAAVSSVSSFELGLDILSECASRMCNGISNNGLSLLGKKQFTEYSTWIQWRSRNLSYFLDKKTVRLLSGAELIFSTPKVQWLQVFERLKGSYEAQDDSLEMIEILLLGCVSGRWHNLIKHFLSASHSFIPISNQYQELQNLLQGRHQLSEQEIGIFEYLTVLLSNKHHLLWKLAPILAAIAIPSWPPLFKVYMTDMERQFKGEPSTIRCCSCLQDGKKHIDCELGERIWCLYVFHIQGSHQLENS